MQRHYRMIIVCEVLESPLMISKPYQTATMTTMNFKRVSHFEEVFRCSEALETHKFYNYTGLD